MLVYLQHGRRWLSSVVVQLVDMVEVGEGKEGARADSAGIPWQVRSLSPPRTLRSASSQCLTPYTSKLQWWWLAMRCGTKECPLLYHGPFQKMVYAKIVKWESSTSSYGLVSVYGEAIFRCQSLAIITHDRASWKHHVDALYPACTS